MHLANSIRQPAFAALTFLTVWAIADDAFADMVISAYGGVQEATGSNVTTSDGADFDPNWSGKSFSNPPYYGVRGTWWLDELNAPNWGVSLDYTHAKVYGDLGNTPPAAPSAHSRIRSSSEVPPTPRRGSSTFAIIPNGNFFFR